MELGKDTLGAAATKFGTHFWHPVASCLWCVHFPLECTQSWGSRTADPARGAVPASRDVTIYVWIKGKFKLILTVQGDLWGLAFFFSLIIQYF